MLPRLSQEQSEVVGARINQRLKDKGITYRTLATTLNMDLGVDDVVTSLADINALIWRGNCIKYLSLIYYLEKKGLLDIEEDLIEAKAITEEFRRSV